ncbi:MAG: HK97 family phage prohead protease, partial [Pseudolabrys sp.]
MLAPLFEPTVASVFAPRTAIDADGTVEGYASLFGEIDQARDMVMRGAFADTLA